MSEKRFLILLLAITPLIVRAQWRIGVTGGGVYNMYTCDEYYLTDIRNEGAWGMSAGIAGQYDLKEWGFLNSKLSVRAEGNATSKSYYSIRGYRNIAYSETHFENLYVQFPIMVNYSLGSEKVRGFLHLGGYFGWNTTNHDTTPQKKISIGGLGGIGAEYSFGNLTIQAEARTYADASNVTEYDRVFKTPHYNTTIALQMALFYNL